MRLPRALFRRCWSSDNVVRESRVAYRVKERLRDFFRCWDPGDARAMLEDLQTHCLREAMWLKYLYNPGGGVRIRTGVRGFAGPCPACLTVPGYDRILLTAVLRLHSQ